MIVDDIVNEYDLSEFGSIVEFIFDMEDFDEAINILPNECFETLQENLDEPIFDELGVDVESLYDQLTDKFAPYF